MTFPALTSATAGTRLSDLGGMQGWVDLAGCYIPRWHTHPKTVTHPSTKQARRGLTSFMVAANFRQTHSPSRLGWSEGWRPPGAQSAFIKWTGWTLSMALVTMTAPWTLSWLLLLLFCPPAQSHRQENWASPDKNKFLKSPWMRLIIIIIIIIVIIITPPTK